MYLFITEQSHSSFKLASFSKQKKHLLPAFVSMANLDGRFCYCSDRSNPFLTNTNWQRVQFHSFLFPIFNILSHLFISLSLHSVFWVCFSRFSLIIDLICSVNFVLFVRKADTNSNILFQLPYNGSSFHPALFCVCLLFIQQAFHLR